MGDSGRELVLVSAARLKSEIDKIRFATTGVTLGIVCTRAVVG
jgi:hypothetical protein